MAPSSIDVRGDPSSYHQGTYLRKNARNLLFIFLALIGLIILVVVLGKGTAPAKDNNDLPSQTANNRNEVEGSAVPLDLMPPSPTSAIEAEEVKLKEKEPPTYRPPPPQQLDILAQERAKASIQRSQFRHQQYLNALNSETTINIKSNLMSGGSAPQNQLQQLQQAQAGINNAQLNQSNFSNSQNGALGLTDQDPNLQVQKLAFLGQMRSDDYLPYTRQNPVSRYEVNVGTIIPATLISGLNSDMPGQIIAQVSQNVYDTATGYYLLIPQGAKLYGVYDSRVAYGQSRLLTAWTRINFPDGTKLNLAGMGGMDVEGYSGFNDQIDNHYWKTFGNAMLLGMISGTAQAGISESDNSDTTSAIADGVTQQFAQTGTTLIEKNLDVQPTITIRGGYKFNIMVNKDIVLTPYLNQQ